MSYYKDNKPPPVRACLFDMDGLLLNSEDLYTICTNEVLHEYGKPDLPWNIKAQLQGRPGPEASRILMNWAQLPISMDEFMSKIRALQGKYFPETQPLPGTEKLLQTLHHTSSPHIRIGLATSSHRGNFLLKTAHLQQMFSVFPEENRVLGDDVRIPQGRGKPAPDIYLLSLKTINQSLKEEDPEAKEILPEECLVLEDAVPGVEAGRRAGMQVLWVPHPELLKEFKGREKEVLAGLTGEHEEDIPPAVNAVPGQRMTGAPGEIDDGWALLVGSMEEFPYERYGIKA